MPLDQLVALFTDISLLSAMPLSSRLMLAANRFHLAAISMIVDWLCLSSWKQMITSSAAVSGCGT